MMRMSNDADGVREICIIGGGFGGLYTALKIEKEVKPEDKVKITLIDPKEKFVFMPLLYELSVGTATVMEVAPRYEQLLKDTSVEFIQGSVESIDTDSCVVNIDGRSKAINFDYVVIACGARPNMDIIPGVKNHAISFYGVEDSYRLKTELRTLIDSDVDTVQISILGGGYSGVELACSIADQMKVENKKCEISLIDRNSRVMKTSPKFNQDTAEKQLENVGIKKIMNTAVLEVSKNGLRLKPNNDENSEAYEQSADLVLCALGTSQSPLLSKISPVLDLDAKSGRLLVDRSFQSVNTEKVFALGDCSVIEGVSLPSTAQVAMQQADITARNILVKLGLREGSGANAAYLEKFTYVPLGEMLTLGRVDAAISSLGGLLEIEGPLASLSRRLVYALRMPTRQQTATALVSSAVTGAITIANTISSIRTNKDSAK